MVSLEINNQTDFEISSKELKSPAAKILKKVGLKEDYKISLALVETKKMKAISKERHGESKSAGVLSFADKDLESEFYEPESDGTYLGEIILCPAYIKDQATRFDKEFKRELHRYFKHGLLHLAGLDHSEMEKIQADQDLT